MPHNYHMDFNSPLMREKMEYYNMFGKLLNNVYGWFYKYSGLKSFFNSRLFKRGILDGDLRADITIPPKTMAEKAKGISINTSPNTPI